MKFPTLLFILFWCLVVVTYIELIYLIGIWSGVTMIVIGVIALYIGELNWKFEENYEKWK